MDFYTKQNDLLLSVYVQPAAKRTQCAGVYGEAVKIRLAAPPVDGKANEALCHYLAQIFDYPARHIDVIRGQTSRQKTVCFKDATAEHLRLQTLLSEWLANAD